MLKRDVGWLAIIITLVALLCSFHGARSLNKPLDPAAESSPPPSANNPLAICGNWEQFVVVPHGKPIYLLRWKVSRVENKYEIQTLDVSANSFLRDIRTFNHQYDGQTWTFDSDWHERGIAHFVLRPTSNAENCDWTGWSYLNGKPVSQQLWRHFTD
jgi:hypothetical protein